jgi:hypothetical protein
MILGAFQDLPQACDATDDEVLRFIGDHTLYGIGIGYVDAHHLAPCCSTVDCWRVAMDPR